jgi:hypothetical protein
VDGGWKIARSIWNSDLPRASFSVGSEVEPSEDLVDLSHLLDGLDRDAECRRPQVWAAHD